MIMDDEYVTYGHGFKAYWLGVDLHRLDGPAVETNKGHYYYINGNDVTESVKNWIEENNFVIPFDEPTQMMFLMKFG